MWYLSPDQMPILCSCVSFSFFLMNTMHTTQQSGRRDRNSVKMRYECVNKILMNEALRAKMKAMQSRQVNHSDTCVSAEIMFLAFYFFFCWRQCRWQKILSIFLLTWYWSTRTFCCWESIMSSKEREGYNDISLFMVFYIVYAQTRVRSSEK